MAEQAGLTRRSGSASDRFCVTCRREAGTGLLAARIGAGTTDPGVRP